jgi:hypothetical protein
MPLPRRCFARCSPSDQRIASTMFDFPQPFGPITPVTCSSTWITSRSANDLNPITSSFLMRMPRRAAGPSQA